MTVKGNFYRVTNNDQTLMTLGGKICGYHEYADISEAEFDKLDSVLLGDGSITYTVLDAYKDITVEDIPDAMATDAEVLAALGNIDNATPINPVVATLTTSLTGANNDMTFTAKAYGTAGNAIKIAYVDPGTETATEACAVTTASGVKTITVTLRSVSAVLSTAAQVKTIIDGTTAAAALVTCANAGGDSGAGHVTALAATSLSGGVAGTAGTQWKSIRVDANDIYACIGLPTDAVMWKKAALSSL